MSNNNCSDFPEDFNGYILQSKVNNKIANCLAKYRILLYEAFQKTQLNYFEIKINEDFDTIAYFIGKELRNRNLLMNIETRREEFIVGGENDPEIATFTYRYLVVRPNISDDLQ